MSETNPTDGREVVRCRIVTDTNYAGGKTSVYVADSRHEVEVHEFRHATPAVAVPVADYNEVREALDTIARVMPHHAAGTAAREALKLLPEIPQ